LELLWDLLFSTSAHLMQTTGRFHKSFSDFLGKASGLGANPLLLLFPAPALTTQKEICTIKSFTTDGLSAEERNCGF